MLATLERGDTVLVPNPSYPIHIYGAIIAGADIRSVRMTPGVDFFSELERAIRELIPKPKMLVIGFPSNPTAMCVDLAFFERVIALAREHDILVGARPGLRRHHVRRLEGAVDHAGAGRARRRSRVLHDVEELQHGGLARRLHGRQPRPRCMRSRASRATTTTARSRRSRSRRSSRSRARRDCVEEIRKTYEKRRDVMVRGLREAGWPVENPKASMYVWAQIPCVPIPASARSGSPSAWSRRRRFAVAPGIGFGDYGDDHVRIALIENEHRLRQATRGVREMFRKDGLLRGVA
jgi:alanine-synthesizing transaminase